MKRVSDDNGGEYRVVSLATFLTVVGALVASLTAVSGYALGHRDERNAILDRLEERFEAKAVAVVVHSGLSERISDANIEIGRVRGKLDAHLESVQRGR
jgi:hypothetical protein